jgi:O-acetyl-ADP-ribose deacetylase (regulator of RNase III)
MFMALIEVHKTDITKLAVDAIVNAANETLLGGGGVDGAIHKAAGDQLMLECWSLSGCKTGEAKITSGYNLAAKWIIHAVGPRYRDGRHGEDVLLAGAYKNALAVANTRGVRSIAFPAISCGVYRYPIDQAAHIAIRSVYEAQAGIDYIVFACQDDTHDRFCEALAKLQL